MENIVIVESVEYIKKQLDDFNKIYPQIRIISESKTEIRMCGSFTLHKEYNDFCVFADYTVEIVIPIASSELPYVLDVQKRIDPMYHHYYSNGKLCLETDIIILTEFTNGFNLLRWMDRFVETYFFTYEYYMRYGEFPYGERSHNATGILESYQDLLGTKNEKETVDLMQFIVNNHYRGHWYCPCRSGKKLRNCHGGKMLLFYNNPMLYERLGNDYKQIKGELK